MFRSFYDLNVPIGVLDCDRPVLSFVCRRRTMNRMTVAHLIPEVRSRRDMTKQSYLYYPS